MHCFLFWLKLFVLVCGWRIMRKYIHFINGEKDEPMSTMLLPHHVYTHGKNTCQINSPACLSILSIRVAESINHETPNLYICCVHQREYFSCWFAIDFRSFITPLLYLNFLLHSFFISLFQFILKSYFQHIIWYIMCVCVCVSEFRETGVVGMIYLATFDET